MWNYEKRLQYPINITKCNPQMAMVIISQFGGAYALWYSFFISAFLSLSVTV